MRVNIYKLKRKIVEKGMTQESLAKAINMDKTTFSRKMKSNALTFSVGQMHSIAQILDLSKEEATDIFLS